MGRGGTGGGSKKQDVAPHFKHLSLFFDVINFLLHHLMRHVLLQMCAQKKKKPSPLPAGFEGRTCLTSVLGPRVSPQLSCVTLVPSQLWASFQPLSPSAPRDPTSLISYTAPHRSCGRKGPASRGSCGEEMDGSKRTAVSSNCKILVILDSGL